MGIDELIGVAAHDETFPVERAWRRRDFDPSGRGNRRSGTCAPGYVELAFDNPGSVAPAPFEFGFGSAAPAAGTTASAAPAATAGGIRDVTATASTTGGASGKQLCRRIPTAPGQRIVT